MVCGAEFGARGEGAERLGVEGGGEVVVVLFKDVPVVVSCCERPVELEFRFLRRRRRVAEKGREGVG